MTRGIPLILFALAIDGMQALISLGALGIAPIPVVGQVGFAIGIVVNTCLSLGLGSGLILITVALGFRPWRLFPAILEVVPGANIGPVWTIAVLWVVFQKEQATGGVVGGTLSKVMGLLSPQGQMFANLTKAAPIAAVGALSDNTPRETQRAFLEEPEKVSNEEPRTYPSAMPLQRRVDGIRSVVGKVAVVLGLFSAMHGIAYAQALDPVKFNVTPEVAGPNQPVLIEIQGIGTFLGDATITWQKDGTTVLAGKGERSYSFTTGGLGSVTRVHVVISSSVHGTIVHDFAFAPTAVNLMWEADTSVPPMYRGKALYSAGSRIKVVAFPSIIANGSTISSNNLSFQWSLNGEPVPNGSGAGRSSFSFTGDQLHKSESVGVDVYFSGVKVGQAQVTIPAVNPRIVFYNRDPLRGALYEQALPSSISLNVNEITLEAQPYFFSRESLASALAYTWKLNGNETSGPGSNKGVLTLRQSGAGAGQARVDLAVQNTDTTKFLQSAQAALTIVFGQNAPATSGFGL